MADSSVSPADYENLNRRVNELNAKLDAVSAANASTKKLSLVMTILIAVAAIVGVYILLDPFIQIYKAPGPYQTAIIARAQAELLPTIQAQLQEVITKNAEPLSAIAWKEYKDHESEVVGALGEEGKAMASEVAKFGTDEYEKRRVRLESGIMERLKKEAPALASEEDSEKIMINLKKAVDEAVVMALNEHLTDHITSVSNISEAIQAFPVPEDVHSMSDEELREELTTSIMSYVQRMMVPQMTEGGQEVMNGMMSTPAEDATNDTPAPAATEAAPSPAPEQKR
ncbi:hypothetical protein BH09SUM1_BH09SUM1_06020 [soil metagenome]